MDGVHQLASGDYDRILRPNIDGESDANGPVKVQSAVSHARAVEIRLHLEETRMSLQRAAVARAAAVPATVGSMGD